MAFRDPSETAEVLRRIAPPRWSAALPAASDFSVTSSSTTNTNFQLFTTLGSFDLAGQSVLFVPTVPGYVWVPSPCPSGTNVAYGAGCYSAPGTGIYQLFGDAVLANAGLQGNALQIIPTGPGYTGVWVPGGASSYIAPTGAAATPSSTSSCR